MRALVRPAPPPADACPVPAGPRSWDSHGVADPARLIVVSCASRAEAERGLDAVRGRDVKILDAAVVTRLENGRVELHQTHQVAAGEGVVAGGTVGFVAGMLLGGPIGGALLGMLGGGIWGARDTGVPDERLHERTQQRPSRGK
jgi:uncharacterized membrane protein